MPPIALPPSAREKLEQSRLRWLAKQNAPSGDLPSSSNSTSPETMGTPSKSAPSSHDDTSSTHHSTPLSISDSLPTDAQSSSPQLTANGSTTIPLQSASASNTVDKRTASESSPSQVSTLVPPEQSSSETSPGDRQYSRGEHSKHCGPASAKSPTSSKSPSNVMPLPELFNVTPQNSASSPANKSTSSYASAGASSSSAAAWWRPDPSMDSNDPNSKMSQLSKLDKDLSNALMGWDSERAPHTPCRSNDSAHAFFDNTDVSNWSELIPEPAWTFPFELDEFQKRAILNIDAGRSVFVAAHTSAGKTVVAEYAVALAAAMGGKAFYTSPIKSLSNQKLRDFRTKFDDVGLVTGDVSINDTAQCVIMTTEILRSMLYRGADVIRDVRFVIFDEVQFLNDEERGVVWEESIIMLPPHVGIIMLSATVPNALEFSEWVGRTRESQVAVVSTLNRPVPLKHMFLYRSEKTPGGLDEILLLEQHGPFQAGNYKKAFSAVSGANRAEKTKQRKATAKEKKKRRGAKQPAQKEETTDAGGADGSEVSDNPTASQAQVDVQDGVGPVEDGNQTGSLKNDPSAEHAVSGPDLPDIEDNLQMENEDSTSSSTQIDGSLKALKDDVQIQHVKGVNKNKGSSAKSVASKATKGGGGQGPNRGSTWTPLVQFLSSNNLDPTIVFCFSKKKCELAVDSLESMDLLPNAVDKAYVHNFFEKALARLQEEDRTLPQVLRVRTNLKRGISAHHAGLLPLVKEITEILFSEGYVKVLFATETFAMGVNMPARAVVFSAVQKYDGRCQRFLEPGEYTQMSGRAGRRGIDKAGYVFLYFPPGDRMPEPARLKFVMTGNPISLKSAFRLTYNMILNVLRVDELRVEEMMKRSFSEAIEGSKSETIANVLDKADNTFARLNIALGSTGNMDGEEHPKSESSRESSLSSTLQMFVRQISDLRDASAKLSFRDVNPIFRVFLKPGRLVIAEVQPGRFALAVVFSIVPPKMNAGKNIEEWISLNSTVWLAAVKGVKARTTRLKTFLLLPMRTNRRGREISQSSNEPQVVTAGGLVVTLKRVRALNIVYMCDEIDNVSEGRVKSQSTDAYFWHTRKVDQARKSLRANGRFLDTMVSKWRSLKRDAAKKSPENEQQPNSQACDDKGRNTFFKDVSSGKKQRKKKGSLGKSSQSEAISFSDVYRERASICQKLVTDRGVGKALETNDGIHALEHMETLILEEGVRRKISELRKVQSAGQQPMLLPEYNNRVKVLEKLGYVGDDGLTVHLKGRCACEIATTDCVVLTEIIMENVLEGVNVAEMASLLSSLVCRKKNEGSVHDFDGKKYSAAYCEAKAKMREVVMAVGVVQEELGVELDFEIADGKRGYEDSMCRWDLADAVHAWASGKPFCEVATMTEQQEGDIVVCVKRLCELLRDAQSVAKGVGNVELCATIEDVVTAIRRDVIFNGSLYYE